MLDGVHPYFHSSSKRGCAARFCFGPQGQGRSTSNRDAAADEFFIVWECLVAENLPRYGNNSCFAQLIFAHFKQVQRCNDKRHAFQIAQQDQPSEICFLFVSLCMSHGDIEHGGLMFDFVMCIHGITQRRTRVQLHEVGCKVASA